MSNGNWFLEQITFEAALQPEQVVEARWTNSHRHYVAKAAVVRINGSSVRVRVVEPVTYEASFPYPIGHEIVVPRATSPRGWPVREFSANNGVFRAEVTA